MTAAFERDGVAAAAAAYRGYGRLCGMGLCTGELVNLT